LFAFQPWTSTIVGAVGPEPSAAGMYQPAIGTPSAVTTSVPAVAPWSPHPVGSLFRAVSAASSALS
jgi:hypothetical protein